MTFSAQLAAHDAVVDLASPRVATPTASGLPRRFRFATFTEALDYAALGETGLNFYSDRMILAHALPYAELRERALGLARRLLGLGLAPGDRVALVAETEPDFVVAFAACQYGGLIPVPLPLPLAFGGHDAYVAQIRQMITDSLAKAALAPTWVSQWMERATHDLGLRFCGRVADLAAHPEAKGELAPARPEAISYLQFSSGSTRQPAGIAITHRALMANTYGIAHDSLKVRDGDRAISWLPFYHDMGLVGFLLSPITAQLSADYLASRDFARRPLNWLRLMDANGGTISYSPSFGYDLCAKRVSTGQMPQIDLSRWRVAGIGGDMIRPQVLRAFAAAFAPLGFSDDAFVPSYGLAETTLAVSFCETGRGLRTDRVDAVALEMDRRAEPATIDHPRQREFVVCGRVIPGHVVEVRGEDGRILPERQVGRIFVKGPSLMSGYDRRPVETAVALTADGWLDTGDLGYRIVDELVITGRHKDLIIINGRNLWPQDLEYCAEQVDSVRTGDVAVFSVNDPEAEEERVVALVQCRSSDPEKRNQLAQSIASILTKSYGITVHVVLVPNNALPLTSSGKLRRGNARKAYLEGTLR
ncbi:putative Acyl-CoA synthetase [uncultured Alphaproteobacteria bacterium]|uniref:Putative Acyl-CoA synthetase n=1 Tax=uncultured Alphaproteobacteria bacterium TaxID=91750 RepID=A0A212K7R6_9PROT|nr:putative Acyl-CoA synthetase [uncultured Alphaproteobacteria bacterium]